MHRASAEFYAAHTLVTVGSTLTYTRFFLKATALHSGKEFL